MQIHPEPPDVILDLFPAEAHFISEILGRIAEHYENADPGLFKDPDIGESGYSEEDVETWKQELRETRMDNARLARTWVDLLQIEGQDWVRWRMEPEDIGRFLLLANDHRMFLVRHFGVTELDMELDLDEVGREDRRMALLEIHFLAHMMELLLPFAPL